MPRRKLMWFASAVVILNLLDAVFTICYTSMGLATESNPMMQGFLTAGPVVFMLAKLSLVSLCVTLLWRFASRSLAVAGLAGAAATYTVLIVYHLSAVPMLVARI